MSPPEHRAASIVDTFETIAAAELASAVGGAPKAPGAPPDTIFSGDNVGDIRFEATGNIEGGGYGFNGKVNGTYRATNNKCGYGLWIAKDTHGQNLSVQQINDLMNSPACAGSK